MRKLSSICVIVLVALLFVACEEKQPAKSAETKTENQAPEYRTGREVFQKLYVSARGFAPDMKAYRLESSYTPGSPVEQGKAGIWFGQFASAARRSIKSYTWSGLSGPNYPDRGISHGTEDTYNPSNASTQVFDIAFLKVDSDKAFQVAQEHGGAAIMKKDPKHPVTFLLDWNGRKNELIWHVIYGTDRNDAKLKIAVDASSGRFVEKER